MSFKISKLFRQCLWSRKVLRNMSSIRVQVEQGTVRGCKEKLPDGGHYIRFSGIPYARPPVNELRFRSPKKLPKFDQDEIDCTTERDACFHKSTLTRQYTGSEDCLNMNVYVPATAAAANKLPVMVWIHGGGYKYDSNTKRLYSPEYLLTENVIVITINYRLHVLGFMSIPSMGISGNAGLKDQQLALEWIHENISNFNGDPDNICLFGESGGAACAHFHVLNSKSRKFIKSAICQSGTAINDWAFYGQNKNTVKSLAKILGCKSDSIQDAHNTLMSASVRDLYDNCDRVITKEEKQVRIRNKWRMVIEEESDDAFITKSSINSLVSQAGQINIPMMFGTNNGDGMIVVASIISRKELKTVNDNFTFMIPRSIKTDSDQDTKDFAESMRKFYLNGQNLSSENVTEFVRLRTDVDYLIAQTITNDLNARYQPGCKQYLNEFHFEGKLNLQKKQMRLEHLPLAGHADDVFYLFGGERVDKIDISEDSREAKMRKLMCKLWTNFAKCGDPTPDHDNPLPFKWNPVEPGSDYDYLVINDDMQMMRNLNKDRMDFWRKAYRKWNEDYKKAKI